MHPVAKYLCASLAYYYLNRSLMSDDAYDRLCQYLLKNWRTIRHPHKQFLDPEALRAGTAYQIPYREYPDIVRDTTARLLKFSVRKMDAKFLGGPHMTVVRNYDSQGRAIPGSARVVDIRVAAKKEYEKLLQQKGKKNARPPFIQTDDFRPPAVKRPVPVAPPARKLPPGPAVGKPPVLYRPPTISRPGGRGKR